MKKNDFIYPAIFLVIVLTLFVIPIGAFLTAEIVGFEAVRSVGDWIYVFLKDQGSLIAGLIALLAAFIALKAQKRREIKQALELERKNSLELLIQLEGLKGRCFNFALEFNSSKEQVGLATCMRGELLEGKQIASVIEIYLRKKELKEDLKRLSIIIKQIDLTLCYLEYFIRSKNHPEFMNDDAWKKMVIDLNSNKNEILSEFVFAGYDYDDPNIYEDFKFESPSKDTAILSSMWLYFLSRVLKKLIHNVRCIDEISDD